MTRQEQRFRYERVAAAIRDQIEAGELLPGEPLPSESFLAETHDVSRMTVRQALDQLRSEGVILTTHGRGSVVRGRHSVQTVSMDRYRYEIRALRGDTPSGGFGPRFTIDKACEPVEATGDQAERMGLPEGAPLLRVQTLFTVVHTPHTLTVSYFPRDLVDGTPIADPDHRQLVGITGLAQIGVRVTRVREGKTARLPTGDERAALKIVGSAAVQAVTRIMWAGDRVVELARDIVYPGDRVELVDEVDLSAEWPPA